MSATGPNAFAVLGDTDWWSQTHRHVGVEIGSRLRDAKTTVAPAGWSNVLSNGLRSASTQKQYAELFVTGAQPFFGLWKEGQESFALTLGNFPGAVTDTIGVYYIDGAYYNGAGVTTANSNHANTGATTPYVLGLMYWLNGSGLPVVRFLLNGRRNIIGYSEDFGNATWVKASSGTATGKRLTFVNSSSNFAQAIAVAGGVGSTFTFSALISCNNSTTLRLALADNADSTPIYTQDFAIGPTPVRCTLTATMGAGYSGALSVRFVGNAVITAGSVVTVEECSVNAGLERDPYQRQDGASGGYMGPPVVLTAGRYRLASSFIHANAEAMLCVDQDDFLHPQSDCQPWGAGARVSDAGGYSPAATRFTAVDADYTLDSYGRTVTGAAVSDGLAICNAAPNLQSATGIYYFEALFEVDSGTQGLLGLIARNTAVTTAFVGATATSWAYYSANGQKYTNGVGSAYGTAAAAGDRIGVFWNPATGKIWFSSNGTLFAGDPLAGTGEAYSGVTGDLVPAVTPYQSRWRLCTHAREQLYRPSYAEALDGADMLPEQHYRGRIAADTEFTTSIHLPFPWGGSRRSGSPLGNLTVSNKDGLYDNLRTFTLRNQALDVYEIVTSAPPVPQYFAKVLCDSLKFEGESKVTVLSRGLDAKLDIRIDEQALVIGRCNGQIPNIPVSAASLVWDVAHSPYVTLSPVKDQGVTVSQGSSWVYARADQAQGFRRMVNPAGKMTVSGAVYRPISQVSLSNGNFSSWVGDNPSGWTTTETGPAALVTQSGSACRFVRTSGSATLQITQAISTSVADLEQLFAVVTVSAYVSGAIYVFGSDGVLIDVGVNAAGVYYVPINVNLPSTDITIRLTSAVGDLTVDNIEIWLGGRTDHRDATYAWLLESYAGLTSSQYSLGTMPAAYSDISSFKWGYWSNSRPTVRQVIDTMNQSLLLDYYTAPNGVLKFVTVLNPGDQTATATLLEGDAVGPMSVKDDLAPALTNKFLYDLNWTQYTDAELAGSVSAADRVLRTARGVPYTSNYPYSSFYAHANGAAEFPSMQSAVSPANTLAFTLGDMYEVKKEFFDRQYTVASTRLITPGTYLTLYASRFDLSAGKKVMSVSKTRRLFSPVVAMSFWG